jgi:hypothetical protein
LRRREQHTRHNLLLVIPADRQRGPESKTTVFAERSPLASAKRFLYSSGASFPLRDGFGKESSPLVPRRNLGFLILRCERERASKDAGPRIAAGTLRGPRHSASKTHVSAPMARAPQGEVNHSRGTIFRVRVFVNLVIARSGSDEAIQHFQLSQLDCFAIARNDDYEAKNQIGASGRSCFVYETPLIDSLPAKKEKEAKRRQTHCLMPARKRRAGRATE